MDPDTLATIDQHLDQMLALDAELVGIIDPKDYSRVFTQKENVKVQLRRLVDKAHKKESKNG
jgi:hypothetical protein